MRRLRQTEEDKAAAESVGKDEVGRGGGTFVAMPRAALRQVARPGLGDPTRPDGVPSRGPELSGGREAAHVRAALGDDYVSHPDTQLRGLVVSSFRGRERVRSPPPSGRSAPRSGGVLVVRLRCSRAEKAWCSANSPGSRWLAIRASSVNEPQAFATFLRANRRAGTRVRRGRRSGRGSSFRCEGRRRGWGASHPGAGSVSGWATWRAAAPLAG